MKFFTSTAASIVVWIILAMLIGWSLFLHLLVDHTTPANYLFNVGYSLPYLFGSAAAFSAWRRLGSGLVARSFLFLSLSLLAYALGQFSWAYYNFRGAEVPYPSLADGFYALFFPLTSLALLSFIRIYRMLTTRRVVIESILVFVVVTGAIFIYQGSENFFGDNSVLGIAFNIMYLLTDSILITGAAIVLRSSGGNLYNGIGLLIAGYFMDALGDLVFYYRQVQGIYWNGDISDLIFVFSGFLIALATIRLGRELTRQSEPSKKDEKSSANTFLGLPVG